MEIIKLCAVLKCADCNVPMAPMYFMSRSVQICCDTPEADSGKINYKCPKCGGSRDIQHVHKKQD